MFNNKIKKQKNKPQTSFSLLYKISKIVNYFNYKFSHSNNLFVSYLKDDSSKGCEGKRFSTDFGFTLVETLVAITILLLSITGPMTLAKQSIASSRAVKSQITAYYLAQEAFEYVRNIRDSNILNNKNIKFGLANCLGECAIDVVDNDISSCGGACELLRKSPTEGLYGYNPTWDETEFRRSVKIIQSVTNSDEMVVEVTINWKKDIKSLYAKESLFDTR